MFNARYADVDPDIKPELIDSPLIREMIGQYDCFTERSGIVRYTFWIHMETSSSH